MGSSTKVLHFGTSRLDVLIAGLLTVDVKQRYNSGQALKAAEDWAKAEGLSPDVINEITKPTLDGKRQQLTDCAEVAHRLNYAKYQKGTTGQALREFEFLP